MRTITHRSGLAARVLRSPQSTRPTGGEPASPLRIASQVQDLDPPVGRVRDVNAVKLHDTGGHRDVVAARAVSGHGTGRLVEASVSGARSRGACAAELPAAGRGRRYRVRRECESVPTPRARPSQRKGPSGDLLKRDHVRIAPRERGRLLGQTRAQPRDIPAHDAHSESLRASAIRSAGFGTSRALIVGEPNPGLCCAQARGQTSVRWLMCSYQSGANRRKTRSKASASRFPAPRSYARRLSLLTDGGTPFLARGRRGSGGLARRVVELDLLAHVLYCPLGRSGNSLTGGSVGLARTRARLLFRLLALEPHGARNRRGPYAERIFGGCMPPQQVGRSPSGHSRLATTR